MTVLCAGHTIALAHWHTCCPHEIGRRVRAAPREPVPAVPRHHTSTRGERVSNPCRNCGADGGEGVPKNSAHCGKCPPWMCEDCGQPCSAAKLCACWIRVEDIPLADLKALFADDCDGPGLSVNVQAKP